MKHDKLFRLLQGRYAYIVLIPMVIVSYGILTIGLLALFLKSAPSWSMKTDLIAAGLIEFVITCFWFLFGRDLLRAIFRRMNVR
ncbi:MAG: hypothetical protein J2P36_17520 [Ktedonobacteraceae bacterium]|nr:hypothetical protein [Ktedonobacteraceae bacterium]